MAEIFGTTGNDLLFGTPEDDVIDVLEGNDDVVSAFDGNDTVYGGLGDENIFGAAGDDELFGGEGTDYLRGGVGNDLIDGGTETDILIGEDGNDTILGGDGNELILGDIDDNNGIGDDVLKGGAGDDKITGGQGNDLVYGEEDNDILSGGVGDDFVSGGEDDDLVFGAGGNDSVYGDAGDDDLSGGSGNDSVYGGEGADTLNGVGTFFSPLPGLGEIDELTGNEGNDVFELGQISATGTPDVFYDDGDTATAGTNDYGLITDFDSSEGDKINLVGDKSDYFLTASPEGFHPGTAIYLNDGDTPELIAIATDIEPESLSLDNPDQFQDNIPIPEVSLFAEPDTPLSETESTPGRFVFQLSEPAPEGGLTIFFRAGDDDIDPDTRDLNLDLEASINIDDINLIDLSDRTSSITIPAGISEASFTVVPFVDDRLEVDETIFVQLIPQESYTVDPENDFADFIITEGVPQLIGTEQADSLEGTNEAEILQGLADNDTLTGAGGNDTLSGVDYSSFQPGLSEVDELTGNLGEDLFVLGQEFPTDTKSIFYDDGDSATAGINDYVLITDFNSSEGDKIQLVGDADDYSLAVSPESLALGTGIYFNDEESPELIAVIKDIANDTLNFNNSSQFVFQ